MEGLGVAPAKLCSSAVSGNGKNCRNLTGLDEIGHCNMDVVHGEVLEAEVRVELC